MAKTRVSTRGLKKRRVYRARVKNHRVVVKEVELATRVKGVNTQEVKKESIVVKRKIKD